MTTPTAPPPTDISEFATAEQLAKTLGVTRQALMGWRQRGLPFIRVGMRVFFHLPAVAAWLKGQERTLAE